MGGDVIPPCVLRNYKGLMGGESHKPFLLKTHGNTVGREVKLLSQTAHRW